LKMYLLVETSELIVQDVKVFFDNEKLKEEFKRFTGVAEEDFYDSLGNPVNEDYDQTKILEVELPLETILEDEVGRAGAENLDLGKFISNVVERLSKEVIQ